MAKLIIHLIMINFKSLPTPSYVKWNAFESKMAPLWKGKTCNPLDHDGFPVFAHSIIFKACLDDIFLKLPYVLTWPYLDTLWGSGERGLGQLGWAYFEQNYNLGRAVSRCDVKR